MMLTGKGRETYMMIGLDEAKEMNKMTNKDSLKDNIIVDNELGNVAGGGVADFIADGFRRVFEKIEPNHQLPLQNTQSSDVVSKQNNVPDNVLNDDISKI